MNKNFYLPLFIFILTIAFALVSFIVYLYGGKSAYWINKKLKIGALLISLTAVISCNPPQVTCYETVSMDWVSVNNDTAEQLSFKNNDTLKGTVHLVRSEKFVYKINDTKGTNIINETLIFDTQQKDTLNKNFSVLLNKLTINNSFDFQIFTVTNDTIDAYPIFTKKIKIIN